jgi:GNAT superfamily N-acetyltransferase
MIREATVSDIPALMAMGERFSETAKLIESVGYDPDSMAKTFAYMIEDENCAVFIGETGAIGGQRAPHPFNHEHWIAQELFWWSEGREGLRLLTALELWASEKCASLRMITLEAVEPERTGRLYQHRGYSLLEHGYIKRL